MFFVFVGVVIFLIWYIGFDDGAVGGGVDCRLLNRCGGVIVGASDLFLLISFQSFLIGYHICAMYNSVVI